MLTRKTYRLAAKIIKDFQNDLTPGAHQDLVNSFSKMFKEDNPRFDYAKFKAASTN